MSGRLGGRVVVEPYLNGGRQVCVDYADEVPSDLPVGWQWRAIYEGGVIGTGWFVAYRVQRQYMEAKRPIVRLQRFASWSTKWVPPPGYSPVILVVRPVPSRGWWLRWYGWRDRERTSDG